jgi:hypothetical protein
MGKGGGCKGLHGLKEGVISEGSLDMVGAATKRLSLMCARCLQEDEWITA